MTQHHPRIATFAVLVLPLLFTSHPTAAQVSNAPFSFRNGGSGAGMSVGGREAILNEKVYGIRPDNLLRAPNGELLTVQKGAGGSALVSYPGTGQFIPQYKGISFREYHPEMTVGVFNSFFLPSAFTSSYASSSSMHSGATVSTWTSRIISGGMPISYLEGNAVDSWTGQVLMIGDTY